MKSNTVEKIRWKMFLDPVRDEEDEDEDDEDEGELLDLLIGPTWRKDPLPF